MLPTNYSLSNHMYKQDFRRRKWTRRQVQILDETDCISHSTNTLRKGMNLIILPPAMVK